MFALHGLLDQRLKKLVLLCLVFSCLSSFNPQWAFAQDQSQKGGGWKGFKEKLLKLITPKSSAPTSSTSTTTTPTTTTTGTTTTTTTTSTTTTSMGVSPTSLLFTMTQGSTNSASQTLTITDTGQGTLSWSASGANSWMNLNPTSGAITAGQSNVITVSVDPTGLLTNSYTAPVTISASGAPNSPQQVLITLAITATSSGTASLTWDPGTDPTLMGYKVYVGTNLGAYGAPVDVGNVTTFQIINLQSGTTYYFAVTAYNFSGESGYSNQVSKNIP